MAGFGKSLGLIPRRAGLALERWRAEGEPYEIALFHDFQPAPTGGGNQFMRALRRELEGRGYRIGINAISASTRACLFNSFNFDFDRLRAMRRPGCRMVHRVDGPLMTYRGMDDGSDARIQAINAELANATILQSEYSRAKHEELGLALKTPRVIMNAPDPEIFFPPKGGSAPSENGKLRILAAAWSDNPNKGADVYEWLDKNLDFSRVEFTFAGRVKSEFKCIARVPPLPSEELANLMRRHDFFLTASVHDPCSNALLEALACGLPAIYRKSGGHAEIAKEAGLGFDSAAEIPALIDRMAAEAEAFRARIALPSLTEVADRYLEAMEAGAPASQPKAAAP